MRRVLSPFEGLLVVMCILVALPSARGSIVCVAALASAIVVFIVSLSR